MQTIIAIIGALALVAILVVASVMVLRRRRSSELRARFGPEYDLALQGHKDRRAAENELAARERKARGLQLRDLTEAERVDFTQSWDAVQLRFVDDPVGAATQAQSLLEDVMRMRGYPSVRYEEQVELLSVHHPAAVQHYRAAYALAQGHASGNGNGNGDSAAATEENRQALIHYRALFEELLESDARREELDASQTQETPMTRELREARAGDVRDGQVIAEVRDDRDPRPTDARNEARH